MSQRRAAKTRQRAAMIAQQRRAKAAYEDREAKLFARVMRELPAEDVETFVRLWDTAQPEGLWTDHDRAVLARIRDAMKAAKSRAGAH